MSTQIGFQPEVTECAMAANDSWYAVHVRSRHEKKVVGEFERKGIVNYLPTIVETRQWSDRRVSVESPLFSCYAFVNIPPSAKSRVAVLQTPGVLSFVGGNQDGASIPESEIEQIRTVLARKVPFATHPFLQIGQRVRVRGGALDGVEGILSRSNGGNRLVISVQTIQRSLSVTVEGYQVEPIKSERRTPVI
jgi:transcription termination/antitermination protein NusG